jgi:type VI secretion system secreted protein VgrG
MANAIRTLQSLIDGRQNKRILRVSFVNNDGPQAELLINKLEAVESLSNDFSYKIELLSDDALIPLKDLHGKLLCVELVRGDGSMRCFTGYIHTVRLKRTDGSIAFYEATLGPWLHFLTARKDNYIFHNKSLHDQTEQILSGYGALAVWDSKLRDTDPVMTDAFLCNESQHNYLHRRWEYLGWHYWYEHSSKGHQLVLSDRSTDAAPIDGRPEIPFQRHAGAIEEDAIGNWSPVRQFTASTATLTGYDFKDPRTKEASTPTVNKQGTVPPVESYEYAGAYGFVDQQDGERISKIRMEEIEVPGKYFEGSGNNRFAMPGRWFRLTGHFSENQSGSGDEQDHEFLIVSVTHHATNNYLQDADVIADYNNTLVCIRKKIPWRPGRGYNSQDTKDFSIQTATVTGPKGENLHIDEFGRVKVMFHWDRVGKNDENCSAWIRVASGWSGAQQGFIALPRIGQSVIVQKLDGNCDRPIITGSVINQNNMPAWALPTQQALSGMRSRELTPNGGNSPGGRSGHVIFDDSNGKIQTQIKSDHQHSQLSLGYITRIEDNAGRKDARGEGFELRSDGIGVVRSKGMLISTHARTKAASHITDMGETVSRLTQSRDLHEQLAGLAQQHQAQDKDADQSDVAKAIKAQNDAIKGSDGGAGTFPELAEPHLVLASPSGIETTTAASTHIASGEHLALTTGGHVSLAAGKSFYASIKEKWSVFVHKLGIKLIAASGKVQIQAQSDDMELLAQKVLDIISTTDWINLKAKKGVRINGGGSELVISADGIKGYTPGGHEMHAANHQTFPPQNRPIQFPGQLPDHDICIPCLLKAAKANNPFAHPQ